MLVELMLIICGLVLLAGSLYLIPAMGKYLEKLAKFLGGFQAVIGVIAVIVAIWDMIDGSVGLGNVVLLIVGLILGVSILSALPAIGKYIAKLTKALGAFQTILGIIALIVGIWMLID
ncbi:MAG: hypothetical protein JW880_03545 [Candidatus Thermoplasmatota archaeon]|nr:hypothetical protein [Candidatus Thermoplasmatota archaeon]